MEGSEFIERLEMFWSDHPLRSKGILSLALVITRTAGKQSPPYFLNQFLTPKGGYIAGIGHESVQAILAEYGISLVLTKTVGKISRARMMWIEEYLELLNDLHREGMLDLPVIERWCIERTQAYFDSITLKLRPDPSKSVVQIITELFQSACAHQKNRRGVRLVGPLMEHLVGAKLGISLPGVEIEHKGFSVADAPGKRKGDFLVGDTAIHVTSAPTEALIRKCRDNLSEGLRPFIITTRDGIGGARALASVSNFDDRIELMEIVQFLVSNIYERSEFGQADRDARLQDLVNAYNCIIDQSETDPSLKIALV